MMHFYLIKILFIHKDANNNWRYLTTEEENRLSTVCGITARKVSVRLPLDECFIQSFFSRFNSQSSFLCFIAVFVCHFLFQVPILRSSHYSIFYGNAFCTLAFVSSDFPSYACYRVVCLVQIIPVIALSIVFNMGMCFCFI